jgi:adenine-specific DNA-methyltransferase
MQFYEIPLADAFSAAHANATIDTAELNKFEAEVQLFLSQIDPTKEEEYIKNQTAYLLKNTLYPGTAYHINIDKRKDLVIRGGKSHTDNVAVILEFKSLKSPDMVKQGKFNTKALHELVWYYMQEREGNVFIKHLIITNSAEWFVFKASDFETIFYRDKPFMKKYKDFKNALLSDTKTEYFYTQIVQPFVQESDKTIHYTHFSLTPSVPQRGMTGGAAMPSPFGGQRGLIFKLLHPQHLLKQAFQNDSNSLNRPFYDELLHLLGLQEVKEGGIKRIQRKPEHDRQEASLLENTIKVLRTGSIFKNIDNLAAFGTNDAEQLESIALELCITWLNRILFMKLLEGQLTRYHRTNTRENYAFMHYEQSGSSDGAIRFDFDQINQLFFEVMAVPQQEREGDAKNRFGHLPYLNSALFEMTQLEKSSVRISNLKDNLSMPLFPATVLKDARGQRESGSMPLLKYLLDFLNAYNFAAQGTAIVQTDNKTLINASVLGLVFEKLNGYRDGSFFTPGFVTMYMCRETIRTATVQKYNDAFGWQANDIQGVADLIERKNISDTDALKVLHSLRICDPAVGSGHFLVSALNELLLIQKELFLLRDSEGKTMRGYTFAIENDELLVKYDNEPFEYTPDDPETLRMQAALFEAKRAFIENCLFGVDINPKSVAICQLRLWIELLKNAYYTPSVPRRGMTDGATMPSSASKKEGAAMSSPFGGQRGLLQTLPNIDINIKTGNSLVHKVALDENLTHIFSQQKYSAATYLDAVTAYKQAKDKDEKEQFARFLQELKNQIRTVVFNNNPLVKDLSKLRGQLNLIQNKDALGDLFGKMSDEDFSQKAIVLEKQIAALELKETEYRTGAIYHNAFEWRFEFPEVLDENGDFVGFDAVVGNPPYISTKVLSISQKKFYEKTYQTAQGQYDLYSLFCELSVQISTKKGLNSLIVPDSILARSNFKTLRQYFHDTVSLEKIVQIDDIFTEAAVSSCIYFANRQKTQDQIITYLKAENIAAWDSGEIQIKKITYLKDELINSYRLLFMDVREFSAVRKFYTFMPLANCTKAWRGEEIGKKADAISTQKNPNSVSIATGEDVRRYALRQKSYIQTSDIKKDLQLYKKPKILIRQLGNHISATFSEHLTVSIQSVYNLYSINEEIDTRYILAVLNSRYVDFIYGIMYAEKMRFPRILLENIRSMTVPVATPEQQAPIIALVEQILAAKAANDTAKVGEIQNLPDLSAATAVDTAALETQIDALIYALYGLTEEEIAVVEG